MRIAQIAPVWFPVPPTGYGGIELVVSLLADGLVERGHDVTLFAAGGSKTKATLVTPLDEPPDPSLLGNVWLDAYHALSSYHQIAEFDVVHDHSGLIGPALATMIDAPPVVHTLHGPWTTYSRLFYSLVHERVNLVAISETQRSDNPEVRYASTVYNGIDLSSYRYVDESGKGDYLIFIGRANPEKGPTRAIEVARKLDVPLKMVVKRNETPEREYWDTVIAPMLGSGIEVLEDVSHETKVELLGRARAMIFPIQWSEPFGLVMAEAMACGTPVIAGRYGAAVELVADGVTGFLCDSVDEMAHSYHRIGETTARACRERVESMFSTEQMLDGYEAVFAKVGLSRPG